MVLVLLSIEGDTATAKTTFALTAPLPIVCFAFDLGTERSINGLMYDKFFKGLQIETVKYNRKGMPKPNEEMENERWKKNAITIYELPSPIQLDSNLVSGYISLWQYFISLFGMAASDGDISTIVLDTATIARTVAVSKYLEELNSREAAPRKQLLQIEYGHPNGLIENLYSVMAAIGKNFVATHHMRDQYADQLVKGKTESVPTGKLELDGWAKTHRFVDVAVENTKMNGTMSSKYVKCGYNPKLEGGIIIGDPCWNSMVEQIEASLEGRIGFQRR